MPIINGQHFGQENPRDQIRALLGAIEGTTRNLRNSITDRTSAATQIERLVERIKEVALNAERLDTWDGSKNVTE